ncbi:Uncharacterized conserved protein [uncultured Clostridium sp.]|nr:Uncharacterized conserved protein [uncultured Clostridium sp.]
MWTCPQCGRSFKRQNQGHYCGSAPADVDAYIAAQPAHARSHLREIAALIRDEVPDVTQQIKWHMPSFRLGGRALQFAACKNHVSLYIGAQLAHDLKPRLDGFACKKDALYIPYNLPLPAEAIREIARMQLLDPPETPSVYEYDGVICYTPQRNGAYVRFPWNIREVFGKGRVKVHALFDGQPYDGSIVNMGIKDQDGSVCYIIGITKAIRAKIGKEEGDTVHVVITERKDADGQ